jgi:hypothetical protein
MSGTAPYFAFSPPRALKVRRFQKLMVRTRNFTRADIIYVGQRV